MGEYYSWVNVDRKEYICPSDFSYGSKRYESCQREGEVLRALRDLLSKEWKGCRILWMGDECGVPNNISNNLFETIKIHCDEVGYSENMFDLVYESYINISGLYKSTEKNVREGIGLFLERIALGEKDAINEYGVNPLNPYVGLFKRDGINSKYIINYSKKICYSFDETKILYQDGEKCDYADPLPILLGYGGTMEPGDWLGDIIGVSDKLPDDIIVLDSVTLNW